MSVPKFNSRFFFACASIVATATATTTELTLEELELLLHEVPSSTVLHVLADASSGAVGAMSGTERVVNIEFGAGACGESLREGGVVLSLPLVEAHVLEKKDTSGFEFAGGFLDFIADNLVHILDINVDELR